MLANLKSLDIKLTTNDQIKTLVYYRQGLSYTDNTEYIDKRRLKYNTFLGLHGK